MKLLFLTQVLPYPLDAGPKVRAYYTLKHLAQHHAVTLVSFVRASDTAAAQQHLEEFCARVVTVPMPRAWWREAAALAGSLLHGTPLLITRDQVPAMHRLLASLLDEDNYQAIHADQLWMAPYALAGREQARAHGGSPLTILDQHNAVYLIPERMAAAARSPWHRAGLRREAALLARYEAAACRAFDQVVCVTEADRQALQRLPAGRRTTPPVVIPICVDPGQVRAAGAAAGANGRVLFLGGMHWPPNAEGARWFAEAIWPHIRAQAPQAEFWAVGKQPPAEVGGPAATARGLHAPGYTADLAEHWAGASVFVVPLRSGGGMRVKILEAWLRGIPVVSTTIGAEGLATATGENILLADEPEAFAAAVEQVLTYPALAARLSAGGRATVERHYDWRKVYAGWDKVYGAA